MNQINQAISIEGRPGKIFRFNRRQRTLITIISGLTLLSAIIVVSFLMSDEAIKTHFEARNLAPSWQHFFGTDWLGRDMFTRTVKGLSLSIGIGLLASTVSIFVALVLGMAAATMGKTVDTLITWLVDVFMGLPHLVALILIAFASGGGAKGIIIGVACTHWPSLTRIIRAEVMQLRTSHFAQVSRHMAKNRVWISVKHMMPHLLPQFFVGLVLLFPHAILHEASITFLGFGLSPHQPAIGVILSESMKYLSVGMWWLAFFPGLSLLVVVRVFDMVGDNLRLMFDPHSAHE